MSYGDFPAQFRSFDLSCYYHYHSQSPAIYKDSGAAILRRQHPMTCPKCGENRAHRSHRSFRDWTVSWLSLKPYRCRECQHRFYAFRAGEASSNLRSPEERRIMKLRRSIKWRRTRGELILYAISSLIFLAILYFIIQQRVVTE